MVAGGTVEYAVDIDNKSIADSTKEIEQGLGKAKVRPIEVRAKPVLDTKDADEAKEEGEKRWDDTLKNFAMVAGAVRDMFASIREQLTSYADDMRVKFQETGDAAYLFNAQLADMGAKMAQVGETMASFTLSIAATLMVLTEVSKILGVSIAIVSAWGAAIAALVAIIALVIASYGGFGETFQRWSNYILTWAENVVYLVSAAFQDMVSRMLNILTMGYIEAGSKIKETWDWIEKNTPDWRNIAVDDIKVEAPKVEAPNVEVKMPQENPVAAEKETKTFGTTVFTSISQIGRLGSLPIDPLTNAINELTRAMDANTAQLAMPNVPLAIDMKAFEKIIEPVNAQEITGMIPPLKTVEIMGSEALTAAIRENTGAIRSSLAPGMGKTIGGAF